MEANPIQKPPHPRLRLSVWPQLDQLIFGVFFFLSGLGARTLFGTPPQSPIYLVTAAATMLWMFAYQLAATTPTRRSAAICGYLADHLLRFPRGERLVSFH